MRNSGCLLLLPAQILKTTEQIVYKIFVQNLKCRNSSLYNPPPSGSGNHDLYPGGGGGSEAKKNFVDLKPTSHFGPLS